MGRDSRDIVTSADLPRVLNFESRERGYDTGTSRDNATRMRAQAVKRDTCHSRMRRRL